ncbi:MAG: ferrous iron transport protein A [Planctomycetota bacterium]|nr:MAG: ferrous iron transport protein A [Planctomycetota bacterium]
MVTAVQLPLDMLGEGEFARVVDVCGGCDCCNRLSEMGLRVGVTLRMVKQGNPSILALGEQRLCFRPHDDCTVIVELVD